MHLDVSPIDGSTQDEVPRLLGLGATTTDVGQGPDRNWVVTADPRATRSASCALWRRRAGYGSPGGQPRASSSARISSSRRYGSR
ncbi:MAG TPA: hypothetical protein VGN37_26865 [Actinocatenispora sp.]